MFEHDPKLKELETVPSALVEIHHSLNTAEVAIQDFVGETARAYICIISLSTGRRALFICFYYPNKNRPIFYPYAHNPFPAERTEEVKEEAMIFLEGFGLIMEQVVGEKAAPREKEQWMNRMPFFKTGAPVGEILLRTSAPSFPADGSSQLVISSDVIRDARGEAVTNGTRIKLGTNLGKLSTLEGETYDRQMVVATSEGMITFLLQAPDKAGKASVTATSEEGSAVGEITVDFLPLDPDGDIKLEALPAKLYADGKTRVSVHSQPICDRLGNVVTDGTPFTIDISDQERVLSSLQVTSKKGIVSHNLTAPAKPITMLISAKSLRGQAQGELVLTFETPVPLITEKRPPSAIPGKDSSSPAFRKEIKAGSSASEKGAGARPAEKISSPAFVPADSTSPFLDETMGESVFQKEGVTAAEREDLEKVTPAPFSSAPARATKEDETKLAPPFPVTAPAGAAAAKKAVLPREPTSAAKASALPPKQTPAFPSVSPAWEPFKELIRFLTHM